MVHCDKHPRNYAGRELTPNVNAEMCERGFPLNTKHARRLTDPNSRYLDVQVTTMAMQWSRSYNCFGKWGREVEFGIVSTLDETVDEYLVIFCRYSYYAASEGSLLTTGESQVIYHSVPVFCNAH